MEDLGNIFGAIFIVLSIVVSLFLKKANQNKTDLDDLGMPRSHPNPQDLPERTRRMLYGSPDVPSPRSDASVNEEEREGPMRMPTATPVKARPVYQPRMAKPAAPRETPPMRVPRPAEPVVVIRPQATSRTAPPPPRRVVEKSRVPQERMHSAAPPPAVSSDPRVQPAQRPQPVRPTEPARPHGHAPHAPIPTEPVIKTPPHAPVPDVHLAPHAAAAAATRTQSTRMRRILSNPRGLRDAIVLSEILGPPLSLR